MDVRLVLRTSSGFVLTKKKRKCPHIGAPDAQHHLLAIACLSLFLTTLFRSLWEPQSLCLFCSLCLACPRLFPSNLHSNVTLSLRLLLWQWAHEPSPQYFLFHLHASFLLPTIYHHLLCYFLFPLSRKKALGGRNNFLLCLLLNPQSLIRCLTYSRCSVYLLVR